MGIFTLFKTKSHTARSDLDNQMERIRQIVLPGGEAEVAQGAAQLVGLCNGDLDLDHARYIFAATKTLLYISGDKSPRRIVPSIVIRGNGKINEALARRIYNHLVADVDHILATRSGDSKENAYVIEAERTMQGIQAEYAVLGQRFGEVHKDWHLKCRSHGPDGNRYIEVFTIQLSNGLTRSVYFDISAFFGKF
jgi:hypothetical protein